MSTYGSDAEPSEGSRPSPRARRRPRLQRRMEAWALTGEDWLWEATADGHFTFSAPPVNHCGYGPDETVRLRFTDVLHPEEHDRLQALIQAGRGWRNEVWHCITKDGRDVWLRGSAVADLNADGTVASYVGTAQLLHRGADLERARRARTRYLRRLIDEERLSVVFQPIVGASSGRLIGAEALSRFPRSASPPDLVFAQAADVGLGAELELLAVRKALVAAEQLPEDVYVSLNVSAATMHADELRQALEHSAIRASRIVLELTEHESVDDYGALLTRLAALRENGTKLAVDDAGAGFASFRHILNLQPDFIKLDRTLVTDIDSDAARRALAGAVVLLGLEMDAAVVAEGIETLAELRTATALGIDAAQGYLLGRPTDDWSTWSAWHREGRLYRF